jgi:hypothetical protein
MLEPELSATSRPQPAPNHTDPYARQKTDNCIKNEEKAMPATLTKNETAPITREELVALLNED